MSDKDENVDEDTAYFLAIEHVYVPKPEITQQRNHRKETNT